MSVQLIIFWPHVRSVNNISASCPFRQMYFRISSAHGSKDGNYKWYSKWLSSQFRHFWWLPIADNECAASHRGICLCLCSCWRACRMRRKLATGGGSRMRRRLATGGGSRMRRRLATGGGSRMRRRLATGGGMQAARTGCFLLYLRVWISVADQRCEWSIGMHAGHFCLGNIPWSVGFVMFVLCEQCVLKLTLCACKQVLSFGVIGCCCTCIEWTVIKIELQESTAGSSAYTKWKKVWVTSLDRNLQGPGAGFSKISTIRIYVMEFQHDGCSYNYCRILL